MLHYDQTDRPDRGKGQKETLGEAAQKQIQPGRNDQQQEHRFLQGRKQNPAQAAGAHRRRDVRTCGQEPSVGLILIEAGPCHVHIIKPVAAPIEPHAP
ncbi:hypothetical protein GCM10009081_11270 [Brevundimonas nasdae]